MAGRTGASPTSPAGGIVVGVDGSPGSLAALGWAIREGYVRGMGVHAVTAWEFPMESTFGDMATVGDFYPVIAAEARPTRTPTSEQRAPRHHADREERTAPTDQAQQPHARRAGVP